LKRIDLIRTHDHVSSVLFISRLVNDHVIADHLMRHRDHQKKFYNPTPIIYRPVLTIRPSEHKAQTEVGKRFRSRKVTRRNLARYDHHLRESHKVVRVLAVLVIALELVESFFDRFIRPLLLNIDERQPVDEQDNIEAVSIVCQHFPSNFIAGVSTSDFGFFENCQSYLLSRKPWIVITVEEKAFSEGLFEYQDETHIPRVVERILNNWDSQSQGRQFNAILTVAYRDRVIAYYKEFKKQLTEREMNLNVAMTFSFGDANNPDRVPPEKIQEMFKDYASFTGIEFYAGDKTFGEDAYFGDLVDRSTRGVFSNDTLNHMRSSFFNIHSSCRAQRDIIV
jgi:hypothetical protein